jgi:hypothetical protein
MKNVNTLGLIKEQNIYIEIGDSKNITIRLKDSTGVKINYDENYPVKFGVKPRIDDVPFELEITASNVDGEAVVFITKQNSIDLLEGSYRYEIWWEKSETETCAVLNGELICGRGVKL